MKAIKSPYNYGLNIIVKNDMNPKVILSQDDKMLDTSQMLKSLMQYFNIVAYEAVMTCLFWGPDLNKGCYREFSD